MRFDEFLERRRAELCSYPLFKGPGFNLNTRSPSNKQWNVADEFE